jgi:sialic acid synthase SpsE
MQPKDNSYNYDANLSQNRNTFKSNESQFQKPIELFGYKSKDITPSESSRQRSNQRLIVDTPI